mgnify:CR=1 FL=1
MLTNIITKETVAAAANFAAPIAKDLAKGLITQAMVMSAVGASFVITPIALKGGMVVADTTITLTKKVAGVFRRNKKDEDALNELLLA